MGEGGEIVEVCTVDLKCLKELLNSKGHEVRKEHEEIAERFFFFLLYAAWVRSRAERPSVSYTKVEMEVAWTGHNLQFTKTN